MIYYFCTFGRVATQPQPYTTKGKGTLVPLFKKSSELKAASKVMNCSSSSQQEIGKAAVYAFKAVYGAAPGTTLEEKLV